MRNLPVNLYRISPQDGHWLFGYYDIPAFDSREERHLALKVPFVDRMPLAEDVAELHAIDLRTCETSVVGSTSAWCFQQGCFAQWVQVLPDTVLWNIRCEGRCGYGAMLKNLRTGAEKLMDRPAASVSPDGKYALSINFDRLFDFRPGYGYAGHKDRWHDENHPMNDGIWLTDILSGTSKLILSLQQLWDFTKDYFHGEDQKICVNHITFNTDGSRFVFLLRNFSHENWKTAIITANRDGIGLYLLSDYAYASHYYWVSPSVLSIYSSGKELGNMGNQLYELIDLTNTGRVLDSDFFLADGHVSYSPNREWILYDSYPKADNHRELYLYNLKTRQGGILGRFIIMPYSNVELRCDLHPVWSPSGRQISFDSVHEGFRGVYVMNVEDAMRVLLENKEE